VPASAPTLKTKDEKSAPRTRAAAPSKAAAKPAARKAAPRATSTAGKTAPPRAAAPRKGAAAAKGKAKSTAAKGKAARKSPVPPQALSHPRKTAPMAASESGQGKLAPVVAKLRQSVISALEEMKAKEIKEIDIRGRASFADLLVIASGTSTRHVKSLADEVVKFVKKAGMMPLGIEGQKEAEWVLVDLGDIVCHLMLPRIREFYALERLWSVGGDDEASND